MNNELRKYIEENIIVQYKDFDGGHNIDHVTSVIENSLIIAEDYDVNVDMVYVIAAYHDIGIKYGRIDHEITSARELMNDKEICKYFSIQDLDIMQQAIKDHRASNKNEPKTIYGAIVSEADRDISLKTVLKRTVQYGLHNYPKLSKEMHYDRALNHLVDKYGKDGYIKLWLNSERNVKNLQEIRSYIENENALRNEFDMIYNVLVD